MLKMTISLTGVKQTIQQLTQTAELVGDHREFMRRVVFPELRREMRRVFSSRGYNTWAALAPSTLRQKARQGYPSTPLVRTGYYRRVSESLRGLRVRRNVLELDSPVPYAIYHEFGTRRIPRRPVFTAVARRLQRELPRLYRQFLDRKIS